MLILDIPPSDPDTPDNIESLEFGIVVENPLFGVYVPIPIVPVYPIKLLFILKILGPVGPVEPSFPT